MNKWIAIPVIAVLAVGVIVTGYLLMQQTTKLGEAESEIVTLEGNVSTLEGNVSTLEENVLSLETDLAGSEATVSTLQTDLASANSTIKNLQGDVSTQRNLNSTLTTELKKVKDPRHFASLQELTDWLKKDDTNTKYANESEWQIAFILQVRALRDGYLLPAAPYLISGTLTARNAAIIEDYLFIVRAKDDDTNRYGSVKPLPSHPLPLD